MMKTNKSKKVMIAAVLMMTSTSVMCSMMVPKIAAANVTVLPVHRFGLFR